MRDSEPLPPVPLGQPGKPTKRRPISRKLDRALDALIGGEAKTVKAAAELAGMARETLSRQLARPEVQVEIEARVRRLVGGADLARARAVLMGLLDADSEHVRFKAAELVLACNGIRPPPASVNMQINNNQTVGWVIDLTAPNPPVGYAVMRHDDNPALKAFRADQDASVIEGDATEIDE